MTSSDIPSRPGARISGMFVDAGNYASATRRILSWAHSSARKYVCVANVHMAMETFDDRSFHQVVEGADMTTSDGMPLVWMLRLLGYRSASRVYGPTLMLAICEAAEREAVPVALYGGTPQALAGVQETLARRFPKLNVVEAISPPFGSLDRKTDEDHVRTLSNSGARIVFVGLGCPKQEKWMASHTARLDAVLVGVGAAFNFHAGTVRQAPMWMQKIGMEWFFRFAMEPRRLWKRYAWHNPRFILLAVRDLFLHMARGFPAPVQKA